MIVRIFLFAATALTAASALAEDGKFKTGLYVYGSVGVSQAKNDDNRAQAAVNAAVGTGASFTEDTDRYTGKALIGYRFNKYFGIEGGYVDVAKVTVNSASFSATSKLRGGQLAAVVWLPMTEQLSLFLKGGGAAIRSTYKPSAGNQDKSTDVQTFFGIGFQYDFNADFFGRAEYERYSKFGNSGTGDVTANIYSLGLGYKF